MNLPEGIFPFSGKSQWCLLVIFGPLSEDNDFFDWDGGELSYDGIIQCYLEKVLDNQQDTRVYPKVLRFQNLEVGLRLCELQCLFSGNMRQSAVYSCPRCGRITANPEDGIKCNLSPRTPHTPSVPEQTP